MKTGTQPLLKMNRIPITSPALKLSNTSPLAGHVSAGLQIHHPKGNKRLTFVAHFNVNKPRNARLVLTIHHGDKCSTTIFPFGKKVAGNKKVRVQATPQKELGGVHLISVHGYLQRKSKNVKTQLKIKSIDVSG